MWFGALSECTIHDTGDEPFLAYRSSAIIIVMCRPSSHKDRRQGSDLLQFQTWNQGFVHLVRVVDAVLETT